MAKKHGHGCLTVIIIFLLIGGIGSFLGSSKNNRSHNSAYPRSVHTSTTSESVSLATATPSPGPTVTAKNQAPAATSASGTAVEYIELANGSTGDDVLKLQTRLHELGYYASASDGSYGHGTQRAVEAFQRDNNMDPDGIASAGMQRVLYSLSALPSSVGTADERQGSNKTTGSAPASTASPSVQIVLKKGSKGDQVSDLQTKLKSLGYYSGSIDGDYGNLTVAAVILFQKTNGLLETGQMEEADLSVLNSARVVSAPKATESPKTGTGSAHSSESGKQSSSTEYVLNTNTKKFHRTSCSSVAQIKSYNKQYTTRPRDEIISMGYVPCKRCNP